jgi:hypothetical protein
LLAIATVSPIVVAQESANAPRHREIAHRDARVSTLARAESYDPYTIYVEPYPDTAKPNAASTASYAAPVEPYPPAAELYPAPAAQPGDLPIPEISWTAGFEFSFLQPRFENNDAFLEFVSSGTQLTSTEADFDYDLELTPRAYFSVNSTEGLGMRAILWRFDHSPAALTASPSASGFGGIQAPEEFQYTDELPIVTFDPTDTVSATSSLKAYTIDLEGIKSVDFGPWALLASAGLRYASVDQTYYFHIRDAAGTVLHHIDFDHGLDGIGPTVSFSVSRPIIPTLRIFGMARGSLLYGTGNYNLDRSGILDLVVPEVFTEIKSVKRDDLMPMGDMQLGMSWEPRMGGSWQPFFQIALEGQLWAGAGSATREEGNLGFFGFAAATGVTF